jgi:hypothetical protein
MATIRKVEYFVLNAPNRPGEGAALLNALKKAGVNLLALSAFPEGRGAQVDLVPEKSADLKRFAKRNGLSLARAKIGFIIQGSDRVGVLASVLDKLGKAGINVTAIDAVAAGFLRFGAIFWVKPKDVAKAARVLGAKS